MAMDEGATRTTTQNDVGTGAGGGGTGRHPLLGQVDDQRVMFDVLIDEDELEAADSFDLPGAELSGEEPAVQILAAQADEFTCASCFLVRHRSQIAADRGGRLYCVDCEG